MFVARNGVFLEKEFLSKGVSGSKVQLEEIRDVPKMVSAPIELSQEEQEVVEPVIEAPAPRRPVRAHRAPEKFKLLTTGQRDILLLDNDELVGAYQRHHRKNSDDARRRQLGWQYFMDYE